jgi:hypothetical protein
MDAPLALPEQPLGRHRRRADAQCRGKGLTPAAELEDRRIDILRRIESPHERRQHGRRQPGHVAADHERERLARPFEAGQERDEWTAERLRVARKSDGNLLGAYAPRQRWWIVDRRE